MPITACTSIIENKSIETDMAQIFPKRFSNKFCTSHEKYLGQTLNVKKLQYMHIYKKRPLDKANNWRVFEESERVEVNIGLQYFKPLWRSILIEWPRKAGMLVSQFPL